MANLASSNCCQRYGYGSHNNAKRCYVSPGRLFEAIPLGPRLSGHRKFCSARRRSPVIQAGSGLEVFVLGVDGVVLDREGKAFKVH
eukprot:scaffold141910_cov27-Prasinocladus_malaysianus.AAC.2